MSVFALVGSLALSCGGSGETPPPGGGTGGSGTGGSGGGGSGGGAPAGWSPAMGPCEVQTATFPISGANHVLECSPLPAAAESPRTSGDHYPIWPVFRVYDKQVPWGFLLHGMEHGAVVIAYNCPGGCDMDIAAAKQVVAAATKKPGCIPPAPPVIMSPDPMLGADYKFVAAAWGKGLRAKCFDSAAFTQFIQANANKGPELFPTDCGSLDREATGWCP